MNQDFTDSDILKSALKKRRMTQEELANLLKVGRTRLNMTLSLEILPDDFKEKVIAALKLPKDIFPERPKQLSRGDLESLIPEMARQITQLLEQNKRILSLLEARA